MKQLCFIIFLLIFLTVVLSSTNQQPTCNGQVREAEKSSSSLPRHFNIVLIGAVGDLAMKYLWSGFYHLFKKHISSNNAVFTIYGAGRRNTSELGNMFSQILLNVVNCGEDSACRTMKTKFIQATQYHQLKLEKDYASLGSKINENVQSMYGLQNTDQSPEEGRLIYLAVPPSAYAQTAKLIHKYLRPAVGRPWMRIVIEKPFGRDVESATKLAEKLSTYFKEEDIYRIDHYLGKYIVQNIIPFRYKNAKNYEQIWNKDNIDRVELVMKERVTCKGRTEFYDNVGVIRDVMQNHLMELLSLTAMTLPSNRHSVSEILKDKAILLKQIVPLESNNVITGQYHGYQKEAVDESTRKNLSHTPTFAAVNLHINSPIWKNVPFLLVSGKGLDEKTTYIRVVFKNTTFVVSSPGGRHQASQIVFYIGGDVLPPMIFVSKSLPQPIPPLGMKLADWTLEFDMFGEDVYEGYQLMPDHQPADAYTTLIEAVFEGQRDLFTSTDLLMASWKIWNNVLDKQAQRLVYMGGEKCCQSLDFEIKGKSIEFVQKYGIAIELFDQPSVTHVIPQTFRGERLVCNHTAGLLLQLAQEIWEHAQEKLRSGQLFHIALSGGQTPLPLYDIIANNYPHFPWMITHIWLVDERCVSLDDSKSNFYSINTQLIENSNIPYLNIHPMTVDISGGRYCDDSFNPPQLYEEQIKQKVINASFDLILLGLGSDGHTASIFTNTSVSNDGSLVTLSDTPGIDIAKRMTLTEYCINLAKYVVVLATGHGKHDILKRISNSEVREHTLPIERIRPVSGSLSWFLDYEAIFGPAAD